MKNLMGTVISEALNPNEQTLILTNLQSHKTNEFRVERGTVIIAGEREIPTFALLSASNANELKDAWLQKEGTSFLLSQKELQKAEQLNLTDSLA
ncbi:hypothetical protein [Metabacillus sp. SLBN-84]